MVEARIKPYYEKVAEDARRAAQRWLFRRNQAIGLILVAVVIVIWTLLHTNPAWIFPSGWWRL
jgi:Na+/H+-translocating membrane pyrophosphatase